METKDSVAIEPGNQDTTEAEYVVVSVDDDDDDNESESTEMEDDQDTASDTLTTVTKNADATTNEVDKSEAPVGMNATADAMQEQSVARHPSPPLDEPLAKTLLKESEEMELEVLKKKLSSMHAPKDDEIQAIFEEVDHNGDGKLTMPEVEKAIIQRKAQFDLKPTIVMRAFQKADTDHDGVISREEFFR